MKEFRSGIWHDFSLDNIIIDYSDIEIDLLDFDDNNLKIICKNFSGIEYLGAWDENIMV